MKVLTIKNLDRICLAIIVVVAVAYGSLAASAGARRKQKIQQRNELISMRIKKLNQAGKTLTGLRDVLETTRTYLATYERRIPETSDIGEFYKKLHAMMRKRDILLEKVQPRPHVNGNMVIRNPVRMICTGSFTSIYRFLVELESMDRAVIVEDMVIMKSENAKECRLDMLATILQKGV